MEALVHGEALTGPGDALAEAAHLAGDLAAGLVLPLPDALDEGLTAQVVAGLALLAELALDDVLGGDAYVVHTRLVERLNPCIRFRRTRASIRVCSKAWPRWREPVTFGGGMTML